MKSDHIIKDNNNDTIAQNSTSAILKNFQDKTNYNPYLHGTTSSVLALLEKTDFQLMPFMSLLEKYQIAPFSGELHTLGAKGLNLGETLSFGQLKNCTFDINSILLGYASYRECHSSVSLRKETLNYLKRLCESINLTTVAALLVYYARAKQLGVTEAEIEKQIDMNAVMRKVQDQINLYYLALCLLKYIHPTLSPEKINDKNFDWLEYIISVDVSDQDLLKQLHEKNINIKLIYENPTTDSIELIINLFNNGKTDHRSFNDYFGTNLAGLNAIALDETHCQHPVINNWLNDTHQNFFEPKKSIRGLLLDIMTGKVFCRDFANYIPLIQETHHYILQGIAYLTRYISIFNSLHSSCSLSISNQANLFLNNQFPIIFMMEHKNSLYSSSNEYRTREVLKIGKDINIIATDTEEHRLMLMQYLDINHVKNVSIVLFKDLQQSKENDRIPSSPYTHSDHMERLSWLSAKSFVNTAQQQTANAIDPLLECAKTYQSIRLT